MIFSARPFSAAEAEAWGMVNQVWPDADLAAGVLDLARAIAANGPIAVRQAKRAITTGIGTDLTSGLALEIEAYNRTVPTEDRKEGILAFNEKRAPRFTGN